MNNLYEVGIEGMELDHILREAEGELTPDLEARMDSFLAGGKAKVEAAAKVYRSLEASAGACELEAIRLSGRAKSFQKNADSLKARMLFAVDAGFGGKLRTDLFTIWGQTSASTTGFDLAADADLAKMAVTTPGIVRTVLSLDKQVLKMKHNAGEALPAEITVTENPGTRYLRLA